MTVFDVDLKTAEEAKRGRIEVKGLEVIIADEATFVVTGMQEPMSLEQYLDYSRGKVAGFVPDCQVHKVTFSAAAARCSGLR